jgi:tetratricopeptide (TPR) repeat protein
MLGAASHLTGNHLVAQQHFESSLGHARTASRFRAGLHLFNHTSFSLAGMARCLLYRGLLDQALDYAELAIDEARKSGRPATLCRALILVFPVFLASGNAERSAQCVAQLADLSASYSLIPYRALAVGQRGQLKVLQGKIEDGIPLLRRALKELHAQRYEMLNIDFICELSAALMATGDHGTALALIANALDAQQQAGKFLHMPNLLRMKGLVLASRSVEDHAEAEQSLLSSIDWAKRQSATLIELKAAKGLAELLLKQDRLPEGYRHLSAALDRTPAGTVSPTHKRARQILNHLQSGSRAVG